MKRLHLFELEDQSWFPTWLRNFQTDYLAAASRYLGVYDAVLPLLAEFPRILDLGSGGGGPWERWAARNQLPAPVTLSDRYPNYEAFHRLHQKYGLGYASQPVDALHVPAGLPGARTLFTAIHHFSPEQVEQLCRDAVNSGQPIAAFDFNQRTLLSLLSIIPAAWLMCWLLTPFIRPLSPARFFWTYVVPLVPAAATWDGIVSQFRSHTVDELRAITARIHGHNWRVGQVHWCGVLQITCLVGTPGDLSCEGAQ